MFFKTTFSIIIGFALITVFFQRLNKSFAENVETTTEVVFNDRSDVAVTDEVIIEDKNTASSGVQNSGTEPERILPDNSRLATVYDGFGNKSESRYFNNHQRLALVLLRTSVNGLREVFVYGQNGVVKSLPADMLGKVLTASPDEIANAAGIYEGRKEKNPFNYLLKSNQPTELKPLPGYSFPSQNQAAEPQPTETEQSADETTAPPGQDSKPAKEKETNSSNNNSNTKPPPKDKEIEFNN